ncbi:MAG: mevalonate kinase [Deltaproteobacteria bacterium]|nr:mevalonate kinase [Deltaproteobacteria bacterium]
MDPPGRQKSSRRPAPHHVGHGRAGGKLILAGEHAVVYGTAALAVGLPRALRASVRRAPAAAPSCLALRGALRGAAARRDHDDLGRALAALLAIEPAPGPVAATIEGDLPAGMGLGFSAAAGVAVARAVEGLLGGAPPPERVERRAMAWERVFHGNPSGVDVAAAMHGGCLHFTRALGIEPLRADGALVLCVGLTGARGSTREMVARVAALRRRRRRAVGAAIDGIGVLVEQAQAALRALDGERLGGLMDRNQILLETLGVSTPAIEALCAAARGAGALGAKLTGSGGGGAVVALGGLVPRGEEQARRAARWRAGRILGSWRAMGAAGFLARVALGRAEGT